MALRQVMEALDLLGRADVTGDEVVRLFRDRGVTEVRSVRVHGEEGYTDAVRVEFPAAPGGAGPTLGITGQLGGVGARPEMLGLVSDGDGAVTALASALKLADLFTHGDRLPGTVIVTTHVCPRAPIIPHDPVPFMGAPISIQAQLAHTVDPAMEAILSVDTTRGNRVIKYNGFAISPTIKEGYILPPAPDLIGLMEIVTGEPARVMPVATQDITPYGNGLRHINSIFQPATVTAAPVVGVAITAGVPVPGSASGASNPVAIEAAARFCVEVAIAYTRGRCRFYDEAEFTRLVSRYGSMRRFQTAGEEGGEEARD